MNRKILIILGYYNGEKYITEQVESLFAQVGVEIDVIIFDDCSDQASKEALNKIARKFKVTVVSREKNLGFARNFINGLIDCSPDYDFYALCDQDDVWMPDKLHRALKMLDDFTGEISLYCSNHTLVDSNNRVLQPILRKKAVRPCFENALVENIAAGNTIVIDRKTRTKLAGLDHSGEIPAHDWWLYISIMLMGGTVIFDENSAINYRQHATNAISANHGISQKIKRFASLKSGQYRRNLVANIKLIERNAAHLERNNAKKFEHFKRAIRTTSPFHKAIQLQKSKVFRQTKFETWVIKCASIFNKI